MAPVLSEEELQTLAAPVVEAWNSDSCLRERVRALRGMQFDGDISHVSITMGISVTDKIDEILGVA